MVLGRHSMSGGPGGQGVMHGSSMHLDLGDRSRGTGVKTGFCSSGLKAHQLAYGISTDLLRG